MKAAFPVLGSATVLVTYVSPVVSLGPDWLGCDGSELTGGSGGWFKLPAECAASLLKPVDKGSVVVAVGSNGSI